MNFEWVYPEIGLLIRQRRKRLKLTQEQVASVTGISRASLANIEGGRQKVLVHQLFSFASALELQPLDLLPPLTSAVPQAVPGMKFSQGLNSKQKAQITRLLVDDSIQTTKEEGNLAKQTKRRAT